MEVHHTETYSRSVAECQLKIIEHSSEFQVVLQIDEHTVLLDMFGSVLEDPKNRYQESGKYTDCTACGNRSLCVQLFAYSNLIGDREIASNAINPSPHLQHIAVCKLCVRDVSNRVDAWIDENPEQIIKYI